MKKRQIERPYIILHMVISVDEKVTGEFLCGAEGAVACEEYYRLHAEYGTQGFICGRVTMEESFTKGQAPDLTGCSSQKVKREDYVAEKAPFYAVSIDPRGVLGWYGAHIIDEDEGYNGAHIIEVLTERASDEYIAYLRNKGISYIFCGEQTVDVAVLCEKLKALFGIEKILLEGGAKTNRAFLDARVIDEVSLVTAYSVNPKGEGDPLFYGKRFERAMRPFKQTDIEDLRDNTLLLKYRLCPNARMIFDGKLL